MVLSPNIFFSLICANSAEFYHPLENVNQLNHKISSGTIENIVECTRMLGGNRLATSQSKLLEFLNNRPTDSLGFMNVGVSSFNIPSSVTFRHKGKPPSFTLDNLLQGMGSELFSKAVTHALKIFHV